MYLLVVTTSSADQQYDVIVVGAGAAGIAAGRKLVASGIMDVLVVEARDRAGGRVWTEQWTDPAGMTVPVDLGAQWLHGVGTNVLWPLAQAAGVPTAMSNYDALVVYGPDNQQVPDDTLVAADDFISAFYEAVGGERRRVEATEGGDAPLSAALEPALNAVGDVGEDEALWALNTELEQEYAADLANLSLVYFDEGREVKGDDAFMGMAGGDFEQFLTGLAEGLNIRYNATVLAVDYSDGVLVTVQGPWGGEEVLQAKAVVVTLPLGVLQAGDLEFTPELPRWKQKAIDALGMGLLDKVVLAFEGPIFWEEGVEVINRVTTPAGAWAEFFTVGAYSNATLLAAFNAGSQAARVEALTDEEAVGEVMEVLQGLYGDAVPDEPAAAWVTRWGEDPFSRGSYSYMAVGATPADRAALARPVNNKVFMAGEATSRSFHGTVNGAWESGEAAANAIIKSLQPPSN